MQDSLTAREIEDMELKRSNFGQLRSSSDLSKTSTRHSMDAPPESPPAKFQHSTAVPSSTTVVDSHAPPAYEDDRTEIKSSSGSVRRMSKREYAMEISKIMGKQLVRSVNGQKTTKAV